MRMRERAVPLWLQWLMVAIYAVPMVLIGMGVLLGHAPHKCLWLCLPLAVATGVMLYANNAFGKAV